MDIKFEQLQVLPPEGKWKDYTDLTLTVIHATERGTPRGREKIAWKLITNLPVKSLKGAIEKTRTGMRCGGKSRCSTKYSNRDARPRNPNCEARERLVNLISIFCIIGWRVFWLTMLQRAEPDLPPAVALDSTEIYLLDELIKTKPGTTHEKTTISAYLLKVARLGGYLNRASDPPPGNMVMWRGMSKLNDIHLGFLLGSKIVGN